MLRLAAFDTVLRAAAILGSLGLANAAASATAVFTVTGPTALDSFSFSVDADPLPGDVAGTYFTLFDVVSTGDLGFGPSDFLASYTFYDASFGGGFAGGFVPNVYAGPQLFSGTPAAPHFATGNFRLTDFNGQAISVHVGVPEPASWALLVTGFGLTGAALRRRAAVAA